MTFGHPELLSLLLLVPLVAAVLVAAHRRRTALLGHAFSPEAFAALVPPGLTRARIVQALAAVVAVAALATAAAQPQLGFQWQTRRGKGVDIVVVLDVSRSMDAQDVSPSRMERAERELTDLVGLLRGDRVGLVLVAAGAYLRLPLTTDYGTFLWTVGDSDTTSIAAQGTSLSGGIDTATQMLTRGGASGRAILVVSDGELHDEAGALDTAVAHAKEAGVRIFALGVGDTAGAPIPLAEGGFKKDRSGEMVLTRLEPDTLRDLAARTGGAYVTAVVGTDDVTSLYETEIRGALQADEREVRREKIPNEGYQWPLALGLAALAVAALAGVGPRHVARAAGLFLALSLAAAPGTAHAGAREEGLEAARTGDWKRAVEALGQARVEDPADAEVTQTLAESLYRAGRYREAESLYRGLAQADPENRAVHEYNAGNAAYRDGRLDEALNHFDGAKTADPTLTSAQKNFDAVKKEINLRTTPPEPPQDGQDGQEGQEGQEGQGQQGEQQEGQEGQPQQGQDGQQQDGQEQQGQDGQPQQGQPQQGQPQQGQPQQGQPQQGQPQQGQPQQGQDPGEFQPESTPDGQGGQSSRTRPDSLTGDTGDAPGVGVEDPDADGTMSPEEAARLVDGVADGRPNVVVPGRDTEKDW